MKTVRNILTVFVSIFVLAACGQGDGPEPIAGTPATPLPEIPDGFCDAINFEVLCPPVTIVNFNGGASTIIDNPEAGGINESDKVAQMQKFGDEVFGGTKLELEGAIDFAAGESYKVKIWSPRPVTVSFKLEETGNPGGGLTKDVGHSGGSAWEELCFDFTGQAVPPPVTALTIIFDNGVLGAAAVDPGNWTFYYDDIEQVADCGGGGGPGGAQADLPVTFDDAGVDYELQDFGGVATSLVADPDDAANTVASTNKPPGAEVWGGTTVADVSGFATAIPFSATDTSMTVRVYSPDAGIPVLLKVEDRTDSGISVETEALTTMANGWETLTFDFANEAAGTAALDIANTYDKASIFFNFGTDGNTAGDKTYLWDDIEFVTGGGGGPGGAQADLPVTFDDAGVDYELQDFGGVATSLVADPDDAANTVASTNKPPGAEVWGGTTVADVSGFATAIPFSATDTSMTVAVYSPDAGIPVRLKVEDRTDGGISVETEALTTMANAWETLTFDFASEVGGTAALNIANTYDKASIFFNFGTDGNTAGDKTYLWDDIAFVTGGGGGGAQADLPITFDDAGVDYELQDFGGVTTTLVADPTGGGGGPGGDGSFANGDFETGDFTGWTLTQVPGDRGSIALDSSGQGGRAGNVARLVAAGDAAGTNDVIISQVALAAGTVVPGDSIDVSFDLYGSLSGAGGVVFVEVIFLDGAGQDVGGRNFVGPAAPYIPSTTWTNHSGTVIAGTAVDGSQWDVSGGVTLELKAACGAIVGGCGVDASFDNVTFTINGGGGGASKPALSITAAGQPGGTVASTNKPPGAETWGGTTVADVSGFATAIPFSATDTSMTVAVYSPDAGIPVRLKVEDRTDGGISVETEAMTTMSNAWETLTFDFANEVGGTAALNIANTYDKASIFFNFGTDGNTAGDKTYLWDDIAFVTGGGGGGGGSAPTSTDFEGAPGSYMFSDFDGGAATVVANPQSGGINTSAQVVQMQKFAGQPWGGSTLDLGGAVDWAAGEVYTVKVWSSRVVDVLLKLEGLNQERTVTHGGTGWEELCFDFAGTTGGDPATAITFIFDNGTMGDAAGDPANWTFYFDDVDQSASCPGGGGGGTAVALDFEDAGGPYVFNDFDGGVATIIDNPDATGINASPRSVQMQKFAGQNWGGSTLDLGGAVDWSAGEAFTMQVRAGRAVPVLFKLEGLNQERSVSHGGSGAWEELCFDFAGSTAGADATAITFIFDLGVGGDATNDPANWTFEFDNIQQTANCAGGGGGGGSGTADIDFETAETGAGFTWTTFENADNPGVVLVANPDASGANTSATVAQITARAGGQEWAGAETAHGDIGPITLDATNSIIKVMVYKTVISDVGVKFAIASGGAQPEIKVPNTLINQWEELTFDFSGNIGLAESIDIDQLIIFPDFAARAQDNVVYFDNIAFTDGSGGGGGGGGGGGAAASTDFEGAGPFTFSDFDGGVATVIDNPDASGINTSAKVGQMQKFAGQPWGGSTLDLGGEVDWSAGEVYTMKVRSSRVVDVLLKLEGLNQERTATHGGTGWEELCFDFTGTTGGAPATAITLIFDNGTMGDAAGDPANWTFEFDDIQQAASCPGGGGGGGAAVLPIDFEGDVNSYDFGVNGGFDGGAASVVNNPDASGINTSVQVGQMLKYDGQTWGGTTLALSESVDIPAGSSFTMKVWSQRVVPVLFKLEGGPVSEVTVNHGGTGWEELSFDFSSISGSITGITLIFDNGTMGAAATDPTNWTFYFDDIDLGPTGGGGGGGSGSADIDFETGATGAGFTWTTFENADNPAVEVVTNPNTNAVNPSSTVAKITARVGGQEWAGAETAHGDIGPLTLDASNSIIKVMVYKSVISDVGVKFAIASGGAQPEIKVPNTQINQWEELTFDFSGNIGLAESIDIDQLIIFPDFAARAQDNIVYFDNIAFTDGGGGGGGSSVVSDFEDAGGPYAFSDFDGGAATVIDNPQATGINTSAKVGQMQKFAGQTWGGTTLTSAVDIPAGSTFTMKVWSQRAVPVLFKLEGGPVSEVTVNHGGTGWEELSFDFTGISGSITAITLIFENGTMGDAAGDATNWTFYFDDITLVAP